MKYQFTKIEKGSNMGTRATIKIKGYPVKLYLQYDGYPEGVLPIIKPLVTEFFELRLYPILVEPDLLMAAIVRAFERDNLDQIARKKRDKDTYFKHGGHLLSFRLHTGKDYEGCEFTYTINELGKIIVKDGSGVTLTQSIA
jgi:hypothetical protein